MKASILTLRRLGAILPLLALPLGSAGQANYATPDTSVTLAGTAPLGSADGTGHAARFFHPVGVALDSAGNVYVADDNNHTVRKVTPMGEVTTLAGYPLTDPVDNPIPGGRDGTGRIAGFNDPIVAVDTAGNLYAAEVGSHTTRKGMPASSVPAPILERPSFSGGQFGVNMTGLPGLAVDLETSSDLSQWEQVGIFVLEGGTNQFVSPTPPPGAHFYHAHVGGNL